MPRWTVGKRHGLYQRTRMLAGCANDSPASPSTNGSRARSGGRVERMRWADYVNQGVGLLDQLGYERVHIMGACVGCSIATFWRRPTANAWPAWCCIRRPAASKYRLKQHARFWAHLAYVAEHGLRRRGRARCRHRRRLLRRRPGGPWVSVLRHDPDFASRYMRIRPGSLPDDRHGHEQAAVRPRHRAGAGAGRSARTDVPALIVPGQDTSHAPSAARYLQECLPAAEYWDVPVAAQTAETAPVRVIDFLQSVAL